MANDVFATLDIPSCESHQPNEVQLELQTSGKVAIAPRLRENCEAQNPMQDLE